MGLYTNFLDTTGGWSLRQVQKWCADGTLPAMMIGGTWAISGQKICDMLGIED